MIFVVIMKIKLVFTLETNADFKFCDTNERKMINIESTCTNDISKNKEIEILNLKNQNSNFETFYVFNQAKHLISTTAFECKITKTLATTYKNFFGQNSLENFEEINIKVSKEMCDTMVKEKACQGNQMSCIEGTCQTNLKLEKDYLYLQHKVFEVTNCMILERFLVTDSLDEKLFDQNCVASDGGCSLPSSYIIWDKNVIDSCHLDLITETNATRNGNFLISDSDNYIFRVVEKTQFKNCHDITFYKTNQDLYLSLDPKSKSIPTNKNDLFDNEKLRLAEEDMRMYEQIENTKHLSAEICNNLRNLLKIASMFENKMFKILDSREKELILYSFQNNLYILKCLELKMTTIKIRNETHEDEMCDYNLPVEFSLKNVSFKGLLDFNNVIRPLTNNKCLFPCETVNQKYFLNNNDNKIIVRSGMEVKLVENNEKLLAKEINFESLNFDKLNFKHSKQILEGIDLQKHFKTIFNEINKDSFSKTDVLTDPYFKESKNDIYIIMEKYNKYWLFLKWLLALLTIIILACLSFYCLKKFHTIEIDFCKFEWVDTQCKKCKKSEKAKEEIEMTTYKSSNDSFDETKKSIYLSPIDNKSEIKENSSISSSLKNNEKQIEIENKKSQTDSLIMAEYKEKMEKMKIDKENCERNLRNKTLHWRHAKPNALFFF